MTGTERYSLLLEAVQDAARVAGGGILRFAIAGLIAVAAWSHLVWRFHMLPAPLLRRFRLPIPSGVPVPE